VFSSDLSVGRTIVKLQDTKVSRTIIPNKKNKKKNKNYKKYVP